MKRFFNHAWRIGCLRIYAMQYGISLLIMACVTFPSDGQEAFDMQQWTGAWGSDGPINVGDLNGDGKTDVFMWRGTDKSWMVNLSKGDGFDMQRWTGAWGSDGPICVGDLNGDRKSDVFMWRKTDNSWTINFSTGSGFNMQRWTGAWGSDGPINVGDLNGDGKTDVFMWRDSDKSWTINLSTGSGFNMQRWNGAWGSDGPINVGDLNGDGKTDVFMWRKTDNSWTINLSTGNGFTMERWTGAWGSDGPINLGDLNGDGKTDVFMWRDSDKSWTINLSMGTGFTMLRRTGAWGSDGPINIGDFNGDRKSDIIMWRGADNSWMVNLSTPNKKKETPEEQEPSPEKPKAQYKPFDVVADMKDENGYLLNPKWGYQVNMGPGDILPYHDRLVPTNQEDLNSWKQKTDIPVWLMSGNGCGPHVNFINICYQANRIKFYNYDNAGDKDFNINLYRDEDRALYSSNGHNLYSEFDCEETLIYFPPVSPWWTIFRNGVLLDGKRAIAIGLLNLDCALDHHCGIELHPVFIFAVQMDGSNVRNDKWIFFARNLGNEGYCSSDDDKDHPRLWGKQVGGLQEYKVIIPGPSSFAYDGSAYPVAEVSAQSVRYYHHNKIENANTSQFRTTFQSGKGMELTFVLPPPDMQIGSDFIIEGEITLNWKPVKD